MHFLHFSFLLHLPLSLRLDFSQYTDCARLLRRWKNFDSLFFFFSSGMHTYMHVYTSFTKKKNTYFSLLRRRHVISYHRYRYVAGRHTLGKQNTKDKILEIFTQARFPRLIFFSSFFSSTPVSNTVLLELKSSLAGIFSLSLSLSQERE